MDGDFYDALMNSPSHVVADMMNSAAPAGGMAMEAAMEADDDDFLEDFSFLQASAQTTNSSKCAMKCKTECGASQQEEPSESSEEEVDVEALRAGAVAANAGS